MGEKIKPMPHVIDIPKRVFDKLDILANTEPIRGGTDGSQLSFMGTPNILLAVIISMVLSNMHLLMSWKSG